MAEEDLTQISAGEFETVSQLLAADDTKDHMLHGSYVGQFYQF
jgi:hypothetical protein